MAEQGGLGPGSMQPSLFNLPLPAPRDSGLHPLQLVTNYGLHGNLRVTGTRTILHQMPSMPSRGHQPVKFRHLTPSTLEVYEVLAIKNRGQP